MATHVMALMSQLSNTKLPAPVDMLQVPNLTTGSRRFAGWDLLAQHASVIYSMLGGGHPEILNQKVPRLLLQSALSERHW